MGKETSGRVQELAETMLFQKGEPGSEPYLLHFRVLPPELVL